MGTTLNNVFGRKETVYGGSKNVWHEVQAAYPVGGTITNVSDFTGVIPAGSMCQLDMSAHTIKIVKASEVPGTVEANKINGLLYHDILVDSDVTSPVATGTVVYAGEIYVDRLEEAIPDAVLAVLPGIIAIKEA